MIYICAVGLIFFLSIGILIKFKNNEVKLICSDVTKTTSDILFKLDKKENLVYIRTKGKWEWFCDFNKKQNSCSKKSGLSEKLRGDGLIDLSEYDHKNMRTILDLEEYTFTKMIRVFKDGTGEGYFYKCKKTY